MRMYSCEVLTPLELDGKRYPAGASVELPAKDAEALSKIQAVKILESVPVQSELTVDPASEVDGVLRETDGVGEGDLIGGFEDSDQESDQGKKRGGSKK